MSISVLNCHHRIDIDVVKVCGGYTIAMCPLSVDLCVLCKADRTALLIVGQGLTIYDVAVFDAVLKLDANNHKTPLMMICIKRRR